MFFDSKQSKAAGNSASAEVFIPAHKGRQRVVIAAAHARSRYQGPTANAGMILTIECSGTNARVADDSFEGEYGSLHFHASATQMFRLDPGFEGWVKATVTPYGAGGQSNKGSEVTLTVAAFTAA